MCVCVLEMAQLTLNIGASNPRCPHVKPPGIYHTELGETVFYVSQLLCLCVCVCVWGCAIVLLNVILCVCECVCVSVCVGCEGDLL